MRNIIVDIILVILICYYINVRLDVECCGTRAPSMISFLDIFFYYGWEIFFSIYKYIVGGMMLFDRLWDLTYYVV